MFLNYKDLEILICRTETTQVYVDNDAIILYQRIGISKDESMRFTNNDISEWAVSFDKNITYSNSEPTDFDKFELLCSGEWWYFDRGVVLNGLTRYVQYESDVQTSNFNYVDAIVETCNAQPLPLIANLCKSIFIYYELYPELEITKRKQAQSKASLFRFPINANDTAAAAVSATSTAAAAKTQTMVQVVSRDHLGFLQSLLQSNSTQMPEVQSDLRFSSVDPQITPIANSFAQETMSHVNDNTQTPTMTYQNVVPARFWFLERSREFRSNCIDYFTTIGVWRTKI